MAAGTAITIDGGPTQADFQSFTEALDQALINTARDPDKFARFASLVLGQGADPTLLRTALAKRITWNAALARLNGEPASRWQPIKYGFGRLDAVGHIFNKVSLIAMPDDAIDQSVNPADAPVSYPFLWNVPQQDRVEWDGLASNDPPNQLITFDYGRHGPQHRRGDRRVRRRGSPKTARRGWLRQQYRRADPAGHEQQIGTLHPPTWPDAFGKIDGGLAAAGAALFTAHHCDTCHTVPAQPLNLHERYTVTLSRVFANGPTDRNVVGTDMWMACNVALDRSNPGNMIGLPTSYVAGSKLANPAFTASMVKNAVVGTLIGKAEQLVETEAQGIFGIDRGLPPPEFLQQHLSPKQLRAAACRNYVDDPANPLMVL